MWTVDRLRSGKVRGVESATDEIAWIGKGQIDDWKRWMGMGEGQAKNAGLHGGNWIWFDCHRAGREPPTAPLGGPGAYWKTRKHLGEKGAHGDGACFGDESPLANVPRGTEVLVLV